MDCNNPLPNSGGPKSPGYQDPRDLTSWMLEELNFFPNMPEGQAIKNFRDVTGTGESICFACAYDMFYQMVSDGAPLDVKDHILNEIGGVIKLGDSWFEYSTAGNIIFGYYGAAWGISSFELHGGASVAQLIDYIKDSSTPLGPTIDTQDDYYAIELGIQLFNQGYSPDGFISETEFVTILSSFEHFDALAILEPDYIKYENSNWPYSQGYFYNDANPPSPASDFPTFSE